MEERTQNKKDWSLEILTPAQMETFLKDFNSETIQYYEYLNDMESTINKQKDILIKSQELDKDFTNRKSNLSKSAQNLDGGRSSEIEKIEAELNAEVSKADIIRTVINDKLLEVENGVTSIETVSVEVIEKSSFKSYTDKYNRLRSEITKMQESVLNRDVKKENQTILEESKKAAEMDGGTAVEPTTGHFFDPPASYNATYSNTKGSQRTFTDLSPNENGYLVFGDFQLRPNTAKPGTFEFRHPYWEGYGMAEWITVDGFGEGTEMTFNIDIVKAIETFTITYDSGEDADKPGDGLKSDHPLEDYVYLYDTNGSIDSTIASFQSFKSEGGVYMESNPQSDGAVTSQPDSKGGYLKLVNDGVWRVNFVHPELGESQSIQTSASDFEQFMSPEFTLFMGNVYKITLSQGFDSPYAMEDRYVYAVSSTWYNSLEGGSTGDGGDELENHIKSTGTYGLQQQGGLAKIPGEVVETAKLGNILTFTSGPATSYQIRTGVEGLDVVKVTTNGDGSSNESVLIQGTAFLEGPEGEMLSFSEPSEEEGGEDTQWTVTWEVIQEDGENTAVHLVDGGTYSYSFIRGKLSGLAVDATAAGESNGDKENPAIVTQLRIGGWKISPDPMAKTGNAFVAQEVIVDEETGEESYRVGIQIGQFSNDSISWTTTLSSPIGDEDTVHTISYRIPFRGD